MTRTSRTGRYQFLKIEIRAALHAAKHARQAGKPHLAAAALDSAAEARAAALAYQTHDRERELVSATDEPRRRALKAHLLNAQKPKGP